MGHNISVGAASQYVWTWGTTQKKTPIMSNYHLFALNDLIFFAHPIVEAKPLLHMVSPVLMVQLKKYQKHSNTIWSSENPWQ